MQPKHILKRYYEQKGDQPCAKEGNEELDEQKSDQPCAEEGSEELESVQLHVEEGSEDLDEDKDNSDNDLSENCMVCGQKEDDEEKVEDWVACEACSQWIHAKCIPVDHPFSLKIRTFIVIIVFVEDCIFLIAFCQHFLVCVCVILIFI